MATPWVKVPQTTKRPVRAKALIINAFALTGRFAFIYSSSQGVALGYELIGLSARIVCILTFSLFSVLCNSQHFKSHHNTTTTHNRALHRALN